jgi:beta-galactosidase/beta-glucuronidase
LTLLSELGSDQLDALGRGYPRPQLRRKAWYSLNGDWDFAIDRGGRWRQPADVQWRQLIRVPFAPETAASGVGDTGFLYSCWYRRRAAVGPLPADARLYLRFGAVDYSATVWVNGAWTGEHRGGYTPFSIDITPLVGTGGEFDVVVRASDDPHDLTKPRGKQDWQLNPHSIWYPRTTGIWQTVWL